MELRERHRTRTEPQSRRLWEMSAEQRAAAMWAGELSLAQLREWSARRPDEVPKLGGEFAWIVVTTPEWLDSHDEDAEARPR